MHVEQFNYLDIDDYPIMKDHLNTERYTLWEKLFPIDSKIEHDIENGIDIEEDEIY